MIQITSDQDAKDLTEEVNRIGNQGKLSESRITRLDFWIDHRVGGVLNQPTLFSQTGLTI